MENPLPWEKLAKYFAGELTDEQKLEFQQWINSDSKRKKRVEELYTIWEDARYAHLKVDISEAWNKLSLKIEEADKNNPLASKSIAKIRPINSDIKINRHHGKWERRQPGRRTFATLLLAASVVMAISVSILIFYSQGMGSSGNQSKSTIVQELSTKEGERATYVLSDGSRVILHAESLLEVPLEFSDDSREIFLQGEAFFEVKHDTSRPFIVRSENSQTKVLGTKFLIKAWENTSSSVEVLVTEGEVAVSKIKRDQLEVENEVHIRENQLGIFHLDADPEVTSVTDMNWYLGWTIGKLDFDDRPFSEVITKLEKWYVIDIVLDDRSIGDLKLSAEFDYSQPMTEVLEAIALSLEAEFERDNRTITFRYMNQTNQKSDK